MTLVSSSQTSSKTNITCCTVPDTHLSSDICVSVLGPKSPELKLLLEMIMPSKGEEDEGIHFSKENPLIYEPITSPVTLAGSVH